MNPTGAELAFFIETVDEDEEVRWVSIDLGLGDELEHELVISVARRTLYKCDLIRIEEKFTYEELASENLHYESLRFLLGKVPVKILVVIEHRIRCSGT